LEAGDVLLADRYDSGWFDLAWWQQRGVEVVTRLPQRRRCDRRRGRRLGRNDPVVVGAQPPRPDWMDEATSHCLPEQWELREVRIRVVQSGCRTTVLVVGTTLLDAVVYAAAELAQLYRLRWQAELDRRALKGTLGRDVLRCKSPTLVRKEVWAQLLAYKLIRGGRAQAAEELGCEPRELRFTGALQALTTFAERLLEADEETFAE
jgi:IS4 transposase